MFIWFNWCISIYVGDSMFPSHINNETFVEIFQDIG